jgi:hypothetical protein
MKIDVVGTNGAHRTGGVAARQRPLIYRKCGAAAVVNPHLARTVASKSGIEHTWRPADGLDDPYSALFACSMIKYTLDASAYVRHHVDVLFRQLRDVLLAHVLLSGPATTAAESDSKGTSCRATKSTRRL